jgi:two-component system chemotaxis response regulator CheB
MAARSPGLLPQILSDTGPLPARHAVDDGVFEPSHIYIAPPDHHMLIDRSGRIRLTRGPKENRFRPAINPLFRSAALAYGPRVAGVLLSGGMDDGVSGLAAIRQMGGTTIVQDPDEAEVPSMPRNALQYVTIDHCLPADRMAPLLQQLSTSDAPVGERAMEVSVMPKKNLEIEVRLAAEAKGFHPDILELGSPSMLTCPECHGALMRLNDKSMLRFRCHTGHAYTAASLLTALTERTEEALWGSVRALEESAMLLGHIADHVTVEGEATVREFRRAAEGALGRAMAVRAILSSADASEPPHEPVDDQRSLPPAETSSD